MYLHRLLGTIKFSRMKDLHFDLPENEWHSQNPFSFCFLLSMQGVNEKSARVYWIKVRHKIHITTEALASNSCMSWSCLFWPVIFTIIRSFKFAIQLSLSLNFIWWTVFGRLYLSFGHQTPEVEAGGRQHLKSFFWITLILTAIDGHWETEIYGMKQK